MAEPGRRARLLRNLEQDFVPDYDAQNMPAGDKRAAYALEHIVFRVKGVLNKAWRRSPPPSKRSS